MPKDDSTAREEVKVSLAKEDSIVKEKDISKKETTASSLSKDNSMEESLLCGICQVSIDIIVCTKVMKVITSLYHCRRSFMTVSVCSHACIVIVQDAILVGWIAPMSVHRLV